MTEERINAMLAFAGGVLVFIAALVPIIRTMFRKLTAAPNKELIIAIIFAALHLALWLGGSALALLSSHSSLGVLLVGFSVLIYVVSFLREDGPPTRRSIVFDIVIPVSYLYYLIAITSIGELRNSVRSLAKKEEVEQAGAGQPATRSESDSEGGDKSQPEAEARSR